MTQTLEDKLRARLKTTGEQTSGEAKEQTADEPSAGEPDFREIARRAVELAAENIGAASLAECSKTVDVIVMSMTDLDWKFSIVIGADGTAVFEDGAAAGRNTLTITTTRTAFHNMAHNKLNPGIAYAKGDIRLDGIPILKLRGMDKLITSIFRGYRAASEGIEFEEAAEQVPGGRLEEMLGMTVASFDEILKFVDNALGFVGVKFFREKSLNRLEWLWEILDREVRSVFQFGDAAGVDASTAAAPAKSLQERLREKLMTAVQGISRMSVSGYLVKRLIKPGSFRNYEEDGGAAGFEVRLLNKLGSAIVIGFSDIRLDGEEFLLDEILITKGRDKMPASEVSDKRPLMVAFGDEILVQVKKPGGIAPGKHKIELGVDMVGLGGVDVNYEEELKG